MKRFTRPLWASLLLLALAISQLGMVSSGETAVVTTTDAAVDVFAQPASSGMTYTQIAIINEGSVAGFFSVDGGTVWARLPTGPSSIVLPCNTSRPTLKVKRIAGGTNLSGVYGWAT